jgi:UDP-N-acetylglucosamine 2-epimerase
MFQLALSFLYVTFLKYLEGFFIIKPTRCTNFSNLFKNETLHVSDSSSVHHQVFSTVHTAMVYVIQVC